jgi:hypothetical protein
MGKTCVCGNDMTKAEWKHQWVCHRCGRTKPISIKQTNADKIRQMTDEELAQFIAKAQADILRTVGRALKYPGDLVRDCDLEDAADDWLEYLKQEEPDEE